MADTEQAFPSSEDAEIGLKKRARRRLVGATALALLAAIILPLVMDKEPKPAVNDIQIRIPSQDAGNFTSRILPAQPAATPLPPVDVAPAGASGVTAPAAISATSTLPAPASAASAPATSGPVQNAVPSAGASAAADKSSAKGGQAADPPAPVPAKDMHWVVQLGAYHDTANIKALRSKVKELGYATYTEEIDTAHGKRTRVRAGPFASHEAAVKAQQRLKKIGAGGPPGGVVVQQ